MKVGKPRQGETVKEVTSIRLEKRVKSLLIWKFGSVQKFFDETVQKLQAEYYSLETKKKKNKE
jgi:hypothetical protein